MSVFSRDVSGEGPGVEWSKSLSTGCRERRSGASSFRERPLQGLRWLSPVVLGHQAVKGQGAAKSPTPPPTLPRPELEASSDCACSAGMCQAPSLSPSVGPNRNFKEDVSPPAHPPPDTHTFLCKGSQSALPGLPHPLPCVPPSLSHWPHRPLPILPLGARPSKMHAFTQTRVNHYVT